MLPLDIVVGGVIARPTPPPPISQVILSTVGPYTLYGSKLVATCVSAGVHCCDLTGESLWVRDLIDQHHEEAERTGAKIVPSCGFDSIPAVRVAPYMEDTRALPQDAPLEICQGSTR